MSKRQEIIDGILITRHDIEASERIPFEDDFFNVVTMLAVFGAGISFRSGDAGSLAQAMKDLAGREDLLQMGLRGREWVKDLTWDNVAIAYEDFLKKVIGK